MTDKQLINSPENCVNESLYGFSKLQPHLQVDPPAGVVFDPIGCDERRVAIVSGGGSGHEPFPAGYVGTGMLTASVSGAVFTSPPCKRILQAIRQAAAKSAGVLLLVPNYTGDVLNFGFAAETALSEGILVESVIVGEDVSQDGCGVSKVGKRGMCGLVLVFKVAGYLASIRCGLTKIREISESVVRSMASMGLCTSPCCKPGSGPLFQLAGDEMELGVGVHGEAGVERVKMMRAGEAVETLLQYVTRSLGLTSGDEVVVLLNNLGALSCLEEWLLSGEVVKCLSRGHIKVCVLKLGHDKELILEALDFPTKASAWRNKHSKPAADSPTKAPVWRSKYSEPSTGSLQSDCDATFLRHCFRAIADNLMKNEERLNMLDSSCGDGDCGTTFAQLSSLIKNGMDNWDFTNPGKVFDELSQMTGESIGGTTGALYGLFFKGISNELKKCENLDGSAVSRCWRSGVESIKRYSSARLGDRTMLDSLETGCETFEQKWSGDVAEGFNKAVEAAVTGCQKTANMKASAGRASYTHESQQHKEDAGAYAVIVWLSAIQEVLNLNKH